MVNMEDRITVRIPKEIERKLQTIMEKYKYETLSDCIRDALEEFIESRLPATNIKNIRVALPTKDEKELTRITSDGEYVSVEDAIRDAVRDFLRKKYASQENSREQRVDNRQRKVASSE